MTSLPPLGSNRLLALPAASLADHLARYGPVPLDPAAKRGRAGALAVEIASSGLRGRGGGWFPTATKIDAVLTSVRERHRRPAIVANAMEGEPLSSKDAVLLTVNPHLVLDGIAALSRTLGAVSASIAIHRDSPAISHVVAALAQRRVDGGDPVEITLAALPSRYAASEESAAAAGAGGRPALPAFRQKPYERGTDGRPTLVLNAETLAHAGMIARWGAAWYRSQGTGPAPGTALVTVGGAVRQSGVIEVALGTPVADLLGVAGGVSEPVQAYLTGGFGGVWAPAQFSAAAWSPESVTAAGGIVGAGLLVALPAADCGLAETARIVTWMAGESAGQCGPCRFGLSSLADDFIALAAGALAPDGLDRVRLRLGMVAGRGACRHPDGVVRLARSALVVFAADVAAHQQGRCLARVDERAHSSLIAVPPAEQRPAPRPGKEWR